MAILAKAIKAIDPTPDKKSELTLALSLLVELAENKTREFREEIEQSYRTANTTENMTAPITMVLENHSFYRAYLKSDNSKIPNEVGSAIKDFLNGGTDKIVNGVSSLVTTGLDALLGQGSAEQQEMRSYYITVQARALVRYDISAWRRTVEASAITSHLESCLAIYASKASIDVKELDLNTFLIAYENQLNKMNFTNEETLEYIEYAEKIYDKLSGNSKKSEDNSSKNESRYLKAGLIKNVNKPMSPGHIALTTL